MHSSSPTDTLRGTLRDLLASHADNAALERLLADYARFHLVLVVVAGLFLLALLALSAGCWRRYFLTRRSAAPSGTFERRVWGGFGLLSAGVASFLGLVVAANLSNVRDPRHGFAGALGLLGTPSPGSRRAALQASFDTWLAGGTGELPSPVVRAIDDRLAWQAPKAVVCSVLLVLLVAASVLLWRALLARSRTPEAGPLRAWAALGLLPVAAAAVVMLMVMGNTQASLAPLAMTLFYG